MSHLLARIMLALLMLPLAFVVYFVAFVVLYDLGRNEDVSFILSGLVSIAFSVVYWVLLWLRSVRWDSARVGLTALAGAGSLVAGIVVAFALAQLEEEVAPFIWAPVSLLVWLTLTVLVWRETREERADRLSGRGVMICPRCSYNMTGLRQTTCPECGASYTIDELVAEQPGRERAELEAAGPADGPGAGYV